MSSQDLPVHTSDYRVQGMTCQHCVAAVTAEVAALPGVSGVEVDLSSGALTVRGTSEVSRAEVAAAVDEAGYTLAEA